MMRYFLHLLVTTCFFWGNSQNTVRFSGEMKEVMKKGKLHGRIDLDTLTNTSFLFGVGPLENLKGEITAFDGKVYVSKVTDSDSMEVSQTFGVKAPFFVYANVPEWTTLSLPDFVNDLPSLEAFLDTWSEENNRKEPFSFRLELIPDKAVFHILNLPEGRSISSHEQAKEGVRLYTIQGELVDLIGFYSRHHQGIYTHHDSNIHVHIVTRDRKKAGHLEAIQWTGNQNFVRISVL